MEASFEDIYEANSTINPARRYRVVRIMGALHVEVLQDGAFKPIRTFAARTIPGGGHELVLDNADIVRWAEP